MEDMTKSHEYRERAAADTELFGEIKEALEIGKEYEIEIEIPSSAGKATTTYYKERKKCKLVAMYQRYALFTYPGRGGYTFKVTQAYQDIQVAG